MIDPLEPSFVTNIFFQYPRYLSLDTFIIKRTRSISKQNLSTHKYWYTIIVKNTTRNILDTCAYAIYPILTPVTTFPFVSTYCLESLVNSSHWKHFSLIHLKVLHVRQQRNKTRTTFVEIASTICIHKTQFSNGTI